MDEHHIELKVEQMIDVVDKKFINGELTQEEYDNEIRNIDQWATSQYENAES